MVSSFILLFYQRLRLAARLIDAIGTTVEALTMTNSIDATMRDKDNSCYAPISAWTPAIGSPT